MGRGDTRGAYHNEMEEATMKRLLLGLLLLLVACGPAGEPQKQVNGGSVGHGISRYVDNEAGVVCWVYDGFKSAGIDCLPIGETGLGR